MGYVSLPCPNRGCDGLLTWHYEINENCDGVEWSGRCDYCGYTPSWYTVPVIEIPEELRNGATNETDETRRDM